MKNNSNNNSAGQIIAKHCKKNIKAAKCDGNYACESCSIAKIYKEIQKESDK